jgi:hypothetical protein
MIKYLLYSPLLLIMALASCDTVDDPLKGDGFTTPVDTSSSDSAVHRVLLEEFTGVKCNNCPAANKEAKRLKNVYGDRLILLGIHAGSFANTDPEHPRAFRTSEGTELFNDFGLFGVPIAAIDRRDFDPSAGTIGKGVGSWPTEVQKAMQTPALAQLTLNEEGFNNARKLSVSGTVEILGNLPSNDLYLSLYLAENGIISPQTLADKSVDPDYEHNHVFRGAFNSTYGSPLDLSQDTIPFQYSMTLDSAIVKENCEVIAFIYNRDNYQVLESFSIKI